MIHNSRNTPWENDESASLWRYSRSSGNLLLFAAATCVVAHRTACVWCVVLRYTPPFFIGNSAFSYRVHSCEWVSNWGLRGAPATDAIRHQQVNTTLQTLPFLRLCDADLSMVLAGVNASISWANSVLSPLLFQHELPVLNRNVSLSLPITPGLNYMYFYNNQLKQPTFWLVQ